ncbi:MAG: flagellar basal-body MS-ring/collar protein FliF [Nitrospiraceae bacterium]
MLPNFSQFTISQRFIILLALAGSVAGLIAVTLWTQQPDMQVLFANLATDDAASIIDKLKDGKVPYETTNGGTTILVPNAQVHDLRLELASQGLPHGGGVGYEIFDRSTLGMSDFVQKLNYRRALQGELARTIAQMPEVERARVHLAMPERKLFATEQDRPRASVVIALRASQSLSRAQIQGVVHLVSSSVEGLQARDVSVVDGHGNLLSNVSTDETAGLSGTQLEYQRTLEKDIESRIQTMLEKIVGLNKAVVRVSSVLDFRKIETTEERFDPNGQVVRSEQRGQEKSSGVNAASGGVPGVESNVPGGAEGEGGQTSSNSNQTKNGDQNYEISRPHVAHRRTDRNDCTVVRRSTRRWQRYGREAAEGAAETPKKYVPRTEEEMKRFEEIVKKAMGYSAERQDQVEVVNVQFGFASEEPAGPGVEAAVESTKMWMPYVRYAVGGVLFLLILFMVVRPLLGMLAATAAPPIPAETPTLPASVGQVEAAIVGKQLAQILEMARATPPTRPSS